LSRVKLSEEAIERIDAAIAACRQGDCYLGARDFVMLGRALTEDGEVDDWLATSEVGFVILTQTCDIVRTCVARPVVELAPLIEVDQKTLDEVIGWRRPGLAFIPALADKRLVADLDRAMTVEKAVIAGWDRIIGFQSDQEIRVFQRVLARKRQRFAFPDEFTEFVRPLQKRLVEKHGKESSEGAALRALEEIRVAASPSWNSNQVHLIFYFVRKEGSPEDFDGRPWGEWCEDWMKRLPTDKRFINSEGLIVDYRSMSAAEYLQSDALDLERLSVSN
jgi:hypothetical protein